MRIINIIDKSLIIRISKVYKTGRIFFSIPIPFVFYILSNVIPYEKKPTLFADQSIKSE